MDIYERTPHYYETDQMRIVHHSNYIRWFEEARIHHLESIGIRFAELEAQGLVCPVLTVQAEYKQMVRFGDTVAIRTTLNFYNGLRYGYAYEVTDAGSGVLCCKGTSVHCFLKTDGSILRVKRERPDLDEMLRREYESDNREYNLQQD